MGKNNRYLEAPIMNNAMDDTAKGSCMKSDDERSSNADAPHKTFIASAQSSTASLLWFEDHSMPVSYMIKQGESSIGLSLIIRARYGSSLAKFLKLFKADPAIKSLITRHGINQLLRNIIEIIKDCGGDQTLDWLILNGTFHCRSIIDQVYASGQEWPEVTICL
jgi:hypothetical protein